ncbi:MAG: sigma-54-dependent Fis family transcriptional regulator [Deltaproteobacteria bacterium]|nr:sigma-54-dependent Fis family transcriptional regulator [Deltaproteobacteria bacterium]
MRISISDALKEDGCSVTETDSGRAGVNLMKEAPYDIVITDLRLPDIDGIEILKSCKRLSQETMVILITAYGSVDTAVEAMKYGAYDYITKPFSMDELLLMVKRLIRVKDLEEENLMLKEQVEGRYNFSGIIGKSEKMKEIFDKVTTVAQTDSTILLLGESGTGKELIANAIHFNSNRKNEPFVKVSCAALPETLLEAELFGYEKGAFTGAVKQKKGRFELANKGTLFLDEIGELSPAIQVKLLRVLQEREYDRLGGTETLSADVRIVCATQRDLKKEVQKGAFREDLYYRLNVVPITLPPLRDRKGDVMLLANHFLKYFAAQHKKSIKGFSVDAMELLLKYPFPGNVRELENTLERAVVLGKGEEIHPWDLAEDINNLSDCLKVIENIRSYENLSKAIKDFERQYITKVLEETKGNKGLAAKLLGVSRKTLWEKCKLLEIMKDAAQ